MALNFLSKHGVIIGVVTTLASLLIMLEQIFRINFVFTYDDTDFLYPTSYKVQFAGILLFSLLTVTLSGLLIVGILKKRHLLLAPWLVVAFLLSVFFISNLMYETVTRTYFRFDNLIGLVLLTGIAIITWYPIYQLFTEIRSGYAAVGNPKVSESNYVHNIQTTFDEVSQKSMV